MRPSVRTLAGLVSSGLLIASANALSLDINSIDSIKAASKSLAATIMPQMDPSVYPYTPGLFNNGTFYWWEAGAALGALVDYYYYTNDSTYNEQVTEAMLYQVGANRDFMPQNQTKTEGNDDQAFWALAAMSAAEVGFPNPPPTQPQWLALAQATFNLQAGRWDTTQCNGGLKWQIFPFNNGYNYKNSISQGCFFNLAARLALYTGNTTYSDWAVKMWDWCERIKLVSDGYSVYDGSDALINCSALDHTQWSYNTGVFLYGAAIMYNQTNGTAQQMWKSRVEGLWQGGALFFKNGVMYEQACEENNNCNYDQRSFKAYLSRWMAATMKVAPFMADTIRPVLQKNAQAAAQTCVGTKQEALGLSKFPGLVCGLKWTSSGWDGNFGPGEQMSALEVIQSNLIDQVRGPLGNGTGGTSIGDPSAGSAKTQSPFVYPPLTTGDKAGAGVLTAVILLSTITGCWWVVS